MLNNEQELATLKSEYEHYLSTLVLQVLRNIARDVGVDGCTQRNKDELIVDIAAIELGLLAPAVKNNRGAKPKNTYIPPEVQEKLKQFKLRYLSLSRAPVAQKPTFGHKVDELDLVLHSSEYKNQSSYYETTPLIGHLQLYHGTYCLVPPSGRFNEGELVVVTTEQMQKYELRDGDLVSCHAEYSGDTLVATDILSINHISGGKHRVDFENEQSCYPQTRLRFADQTALSKTLNTLIPIGLGQRVLSVGASKAKQDEFAVSVLNGVLSSSQVVLFVLLTETSQEREREVRRILSNAQVVCCGYDESADEIIRRTDMLVKRAKRFVEYGLNVCFVVDSLTTLARAYDRSSYAQGETLACGVKETTLQYIRRLVGLGRAFENGSSLTFIGTLPEFYGSHFQAEVAAVANSRLQILDRLDGFSISFAQSGTERAKSLLTDEEYAILHGVSSSFIPKYGETALWQLLETTSTKEEFVQAVKKKF